MLLLHLLQGALTLFNQQAYADNISKFYNKMSKNMIFFSNLVTVFGITKIN